MDNQDSVSRRAALQISAAAAAGIATQTTAQILQAAAQPAAAAATVTISEYIAIRLAQLGCKSLFGVPGATCDPVFDAASRHGVKLMITASDLEAGYAADAYARLRGIGAVCVTYGVGTLSLVNAIAGAYIERSPVVLINGGPSAHDLQQYQQFNTLFSHSMGPVPPRRPGATPVPEANLLVDLAVFSRVTVKAVRIASATNAAAQIDDALQTAKREQRPVYIEVSKALWEPTEPTLRVASPTAPLPRPPLPAAAGEDAIAGQIVTKLRDAQRPVLLLGEQIARYELADAVTSLTDKLKIPYATSFLGKSVISEQGSHFIGVYDGTHAPPSVSNALMQSDAILSLGCTFGRSYRDLIAAKTSVLQQVGDGLYKNGTAASVAANLTHVVNALNAKPWTPKGEHSAGRLLNGRSFAQRRASQRPGRAELPGPGLTYNGLMQRVSDFLDASFVSMTDTSLCQYPAADMNIPEKNAYVCNGIWSAIGYSPAAAIGVGMAEKDSSRMRRPLVICGDGGFQMTAQALSTLARNNIRAIVLVLDNALYAIEEWVIDERGPYFRDPNAQPTAHLKLAQWDYVLLAQALGVTSTQRVTTADELTQALQTFKNANGPALISVAMNPRSLPSELAT